MMAIIQTLPTAVVHLIAAGEVIDSLAAATRELLENSIDAQATRINISVWTETLSIQVSDNGCGISVEDLTLAATPHTTSKIHTEQDLHQINSLGFRGEALQSLAQLADLQICSRLNNREALDNSGWQVNYDHMGNVQEIRAVALSPGTVVTVRHLFANLSARLEKLPIISQQLRKIQLTIQQMSIAHPHITWQADLDDRNWFAIWAGTGMHDILPQIISSIKSGDLVNGESSIDSQSHIQLTLGLPDRISRYRPDWVKVAINGRFVQFPEMEQTIFAAMARTLPSRRYPICVAHLHISPDCVDWNRHPAKNEIYLHELDRWRDRLSALITQTLQTGGISSSAAVHQLLRVAELTQPYNPSSPSQPLQPVKAIAQVHDTYILAEHPAGLWLIEQHVADERILFEQIEHQWQIIAIEEPIILKNLSELRVERLQAISIEIEPFGENLWAVRSIPQILIGQADIPAILLELSLQDDLLAAKATAACRSAIRNGTALDLLAMQDIVDRWQNTRNPHTCPHGRPICLSLESTQLARFFKRNWIIGKS